MAPEVITSDAWSGNGYSTAADIWSTGITAIELAQQFPPHWELKPALKALFKIPTAPAPALDVPERWSTNFTDWLELAVAKQSAHRAEAHELLSHPFVAQAGTPSQQAYLLMPVAQVGGTAVAARMATAGSGSRERLEGGDAAKPLQKVVDDTLQKVRGCGREGRGAPGAWESRCCLRTRLPPRADTPAALGHHLHPPSLTRRPRSL